MFDQTEGIFGFITKLLLLIVAIILVIVIVLK